MSKKTTIRKGKGKRPKQPKPEPFDPTSLDPSLLTNPWVKTVKKAFTDAAAFRAKGKQKIAQLEMEIEYIRAEIADREEHALFVLGAFYTAMSGGEVDSVLWPSGKKQFKDTVRKERKTDDTKWKVFDEGSRRDLEKRLEGSGWFMTTDPRRKDGVLKVELEHERHGVPKEDLLAKAAKKINSAREFLKEFTLGFMGLDLLTKLAPFKGKNYFNEHKPMMRERRDRRERQKDHVKDLFLSVRSQAQPQAQPP